MARTRMGKSTLMHHVITHKLREKAAGRDGDAIIVVDPHADLVADLLGHVPESLIEQVRLVDLGAEEGLPGINLLDTRIFSDRDRTADSVVRVAKGLWEQWGPRTAKSVYRQGLRWSFGWGIFTDEAIRKKTSRDRRITNRHPLVEAGISRNN